MKDGGKLFISVPNGRSLFEIAWRIDLKIARATGRYLRPSEPHLQRNSPKKWKSILRASGFEVVRHEMAIGFFANTVAALVQLPMTLGGRLLRKIGINVDAAGLAHRICSGHRMAMVDRLDQKTKRLFVPLYGWNLFIAMPGRLEETNRFRQQDARRFDNGGRFRKSRRAKDHHRGSATLLRFILRVGWFLDTSTRQE
jgi:hypothetical protein